MFLQLPLHKVHVLVFLVVFEAVKCILTWERFIERVDYVLMCKDKIYYSL